LAVAPGVERLRRLITDGSRLAPIARLLGARVLSVEEGRIQVEFAVKDDFMHPGGAVQGGIVTAYLDMCMAMAAHTLFDSGEFFTTSALTVNFLAPITDGPVVAEGTVLKKGRSTVFLEAAVRDSRGRDYAHATSVGSIRRSK
jgi:uncharacterized protein (TIGR00369 family)